MNVRRAAVSGSIAVRGVGVAAIVTGQFRRGPSDTAGLVTGSFGLVIGLGFILWGYVMYRSDRRTDHTLRVAGGTSSGSSP